MNGDNTKPKRKSTTGLWIAIAVLCAILFFSILMNAGLFIGLMAKTGKKMTVFEEGGVDEYPQLTEEWSYGHGDTKAVRIAIDGIIMREAEDGLFQESEDKIEKILQQIRAAAQDDDVKAIIVEVDSPGGGITASDEIYAALMHFKETDDERKIVVFIRDLAASGGYYVAMAGDWLIAEPTSVVGSIGVIMQSLNWKTLSEKIGVHDTTIKSGKNKDMLNPFRDTPPEQLALLQEMIDAMYNHFVDIVHTGRGIEIDKLKPLADGRIFTSEQAKELTLIDDIGYWDDAVKKTAELLGEKSVKIIRYNSEPHFLKLFQSMKMPINFSSLTHGEPARLMYLWQP